MAKLKIYDRHHAEYDDLYSLHAKSKDDVIKVVRKLKRHFKIMVGGDNIRFTKRYGGGQASIHWLKFSRSPPYKLELICHEVAHQYEYQLYAKMGHSKDFEWCMKQVAEYTRKKGYFSMEIEWTTRAEGATADKIDNTLNNIK